MERSVTAGKPRTSISFTTCQAENTEEVLAEIARYVGQKSGLQAEFPAGLGWRERFSELDAGRIDVGWICGLPYILHAGKEDSKVELLVAPVMKAERYGGRPVYFSDVVVRADCPYQTFADLKGATWSFNETESQSGYGVVAAKLASLGLDWSYFEQLVESGSHAASLRLILNRQVEASAIDSTFLEWVLPRRPDIREGIRVIDAFGPSPIPPLVVARGLPRTLRGRLKTILTHMHNDAAGRAVLDVGQLSRFVEVSDHVYDPIRVMYRLSSERGLL